MLLGIEVLLGTRTKNKDSAGGGVGCVEKSCERMTKEMKKKRSERGWFKIS